MQFHVVRTVHGNTRALAFHESRQALLPSCMPDSYRMLHLHQSNRPVIALLSSPHI
jgi:hypothetical protein